MVRFLGNMLQKVGSSEWRRRHWKRARLPVGLVSGTIAVVAGLTTIADSKSFSSLLTRLGLRKESPVQEIPKAETAPGVAGSSGGEAAAVSRERRIESIPAEEAKPSGDHPTAKDGASFDASLLPSPASGLGSPLPEPLRGSTPGASVSGVTASWPAVGQEAWLDKDLPPGMIKDSDFKPLDNDYARQKGLKVRIDRIEDGRVHLSSRTSPIIRGNMKLDQFLDHFSPQPVPPSP